MILSNKRFFVLGTAKAGTTTLYHYLNNHFSVQLSKPKETWFFDTNDYNKGIDYYKNTYFNNIKTNKMSGEVATSYLFVPYVPDRIYKSFGNDIKLIAILRNPVCRAYSDWWMMYSFGMENLSFKDAITKNINRIKRGDNFRGKLGELRWNEHINYISKNKNIRHRTYIDYGYYDEQIQRYFNLFGQENIKVILFESFLNNKQKIFDNICDYLNIPQKNISNIPAHNIGINNRILSQLIRKFSKYGFTKHLTDRQRRILNMLFIRKNKLKKIDPLLLKRLKDHYISHVEKLEKLLNLEIIGNEWEL